MFCFFMIKTAILQQLLDASVPGVSQNKLNLRENLALYQVEFTKYPILFLVMFCTDGAIWPDCLSSVSQFKVHTNGRTQVHSARLSWW